MTFAIVTCILGVVLVLIGILLGLLNMKKAFNKGIDGNVFSRHLIAMGCVSLGGATTIISVTAIVIARGFIH
jgi:hypothetical protein